MAKTIEVEFKFQVLDRKQVESFLNELNFVGEKRTIDTYLDTVQGDLFRKGIFLRIRDNKKLDFKYNLTDFECQHGHCHEHSFKLPLTSDELPGLNENCELLQMQKIAKPDLTEFKEKNALTDSMVIDKMRKTFKDKEFEFSFDEVKGLGTFLEIEANPESDENLGEIKEQMMHRLKHLNLKLIPTGYNELYWRKHNFELYKQGRYLLQEDR